MDDDATMRELVSAVLRDEGFDVRAASDGAGGVEMVRAVDPELVVLDVGLPGIDGFEVCRQLRIFTSAYIVMLTAKGHEVDRVIGLTVGADDYVTKPFSARELTARVQAMLRRPRQQVTATARSFGELVIDPVARVVRVGRQEVPLTKIEFDLLDCLSSSPRTVFTRRQLIDRVWGADWYGDEHGVDVHMSNMRRKIGGDTGHPYVLTVRGVGYRMGGGS